jgi:hypothetical protein
MTSLFYGMVGSFRWHLTALTRLAQFRQAVYTQHCSSHSMMLLAASGNPRSGRWRGCLLMAAPLDPLQGSPAQGRRRRGHRRMRRQRPATPAPGGRPTGSNSRPGTICACAANGSPHAGRCTSILSRWCAACSMALTTSPSSADPVAGRVGPAPPGAHARGELAGLPGALRFGALFPLW